MLYTFQGLRLMIGIWIAVPPVCLVSVLIKLFQCKAEPQAPAVSVTRGQTITFSIRIKNRGLLPVAGVRADMRWHFRGAKDVRQRRWLRGISGRSGRKIEFEFQTAHCGRVEATVAKARMYDCLGLFSVPLRRSGSVSIPVMPVYIPMGENEMERIVGLLNARSSRGDEDMIVREYQPGDSVRSIHWKLMAKSENLQVKDHEADKAVRLYLNMTEEVLADADKRDAFLERACTVMTFFSEISEEGFLVFWRSEGLLQSRKITTAEELHACLAELIDVGCVGVGTDEDAICKQGFHLEADGRLYIGELCIDED